MKHPIDFTADAEALIARMDLDVRASLLSGSSFWHLQDVAEHGLPKTMVSDGPHGLRKQSAHADHLGMRSSAGHLLSDRCHAGFKLGYRPDCRGGRRNWSRMSGGRRCRFAGPRVNIKRSPLAAAILNITAKTRIWPEPWPSPL